MLEPGAPPGQVITERVRSSDACEQRTSDHDSRTHDVLEALPLSALRIGSDGVVVAANSAWATLSGLDEQASLGTGWSQVVVGADGLRRALARAMVSRESGSGDHQLCLDGNRSWSRWWWRPDGDGLVVAVASIDEDKQREQQLWFSATHDSLTELTNRTEFMAALERALHRGRRSHRPPAVIYIDLDDFKAINDLGGHHLGDEVLRAVARRVSEAVRPADIAARIGGDEFAVVSEGLADRVDVERLAERIRRAVEHQVVIGDQTLPVRVTTGVVVARAADDPESLLSRADLEMYGEKRRRPPRPRDSRHRCPNTATCDRYRSDGSGAGADSELTQATEALEEAIEHLRHAWTTAAGDEETRELGERLNRAAHLAQSASRLLSSEVLL